MSVALGVIFIIISVICDQLSYWVHMKTLHLHCPTVLKLWVLHPWFSWIMGFICPKVWTLNVMAYQRGWHDWDKKKIHKYKKNETLSVCSDINCKAKVKAFVVKVLVLFRKLKKGHILELFSRLLGRMGHKQAWHITLSYKN